LKHRFFILLVILSIGRLNAQMTNPYVDDKLLHFGFCVGTNLMHYSATPSLDTINNEVYQTGVSSMLPGLSVGFLMDIRMARHWNLRITPTYHFGLRTIRYNTVSGNPMPMGLPNYVEMTTHAIDLPIYIKWSAEREKNYRPYLLAGGGAQCDFGGSEECALMQRPWDFFVSVGAGCDIYFNWFKFCPEIKYSIGFQDLLVPVDERRELETGKQFYTNALQKIKSRMLTIVFYFE